MSNQLQIIDLNGGALALPAHLANLPTIVGKLAQGDTRNRIGLKGREFHIFRGGIEEGVLETKHADIIIVGAYLHISRIYFDKPYEEGVALAPVCFSSNGITPEPDSSELQSDKCGTCPQNVKGSSLGGGEKSKACGFFRRIAVVLAGDPEFTIFQIDLKSMSIWGDATPAQGKFNFTEFAKKLAAHHVDAGMVITRLTFDPQVSVPALQFQAIGYIDTEQATKIVELVESGAVKPALELNLSSNASDTVPPAAVVPPATQAPASKPPAPRIAPLPAAPVARVASAPRKPAVPAVARPVVATQAPKITRPATVAMPPAEDDTPDPPAVIRYGQPRNPQAPLATTRPAMRQAAPKATAEEVQQDVDALIAELDG